MKYNKLVRDRIPEIIEASGKSCVTEILSDERYYRIGGGKKHGQYAKTGSALPSSRPV